MKLLLALHPVAWGWSWLPFLRLASSGESKLFMVGRACQAAQEFTRKSGNQEELEARTLKMGPRTLEP